MKHSLETLRPSRITRSAGTLLSALALLGASATNLQAQTDPNLFAYDGMNYPTDVEAGGFGILYNADFEFFGPLADPGFGWLDGRAGYWKFRKNVDNRGDGTNYYDGTIILANSLSYSSLTTKGNHMHLKSALNRDANGQLSNAEIARVLATPIAGAAGTRTYLSFLGRRVGLAANPTSEAYRDTNTNEIDYPWGDNLYPRGATVRVMTRSISGATTTYSEALAVGNFSNRNKDTWSIFGSGIEVVHSEKPFGTSDHTNFVVLRIDHIGDTTVPDEVYLWIDPDLYEAENTATADIHLTFPAPTVPGTRATDFSDIFFICPWAGNAQYANGPDNTAGTADDLLYRPPAEFLFDELRLGTTWASVTPYTPKPELRSEPADLQIPVGATLRLEATIAGPNLTYVWKKGTATVGTNSNVLEIANATAANSGTYSLTATNTHGTVTTRNIVVDVSGTAVAPTITSEPVGQVFQAGDDLTLSVAVSGSNPLNYVWYHNGEILPDGPNSATLTINNATAANAGTYYVVVNNSAGDDTSATVVLAYGETNIRYGAIPSNLEVMGGLGLEYQLESSGDMNSWHTVQTLTGTGDWQSVDVGGELSAGRYFFRTSEVLPPQ